MEKEDIDFVYRMTLAEQWNDMRNDVARMLDFEPKGCFIAEVDGKPAGHVFSIKYGLLGWIGLLIVSSNHRRKGIGTTLMKKAIDYLLNEKVETIKLDAVPEIADLYRKLGFVDEYDSLRFVGINRSIRLPKSSATKPMIKDMAADIAEFDAKYFGADRTKVLRRLFSENPEFSFVSFSGSNIVGYITCRKAGNGYKLGPWTCDPQTPQVAEELLATCLSKVKMNVEVYVGLPSPNKVAFKILLTDGFTQYSKSIRMRFGKKLKTENPRGIFAIAGPMKG